MYFIDKKKYLTLEYSKTVKCIRCFSVCKIEMYHTYLVIWFKNNRGNTLTQLNCFLLCILPKKPLSIRSEYVIMIIKPCLFHSRVATFQLCSFKKPRSTGQNYLERCRCRVCSKIYITESKNGLGLRDLENRLVPRPLAQAGTPSSRTDFSEPCPTLPRTLPGMGYP